MRGVYFDEYHSADDWNLILHSKRIDPPTPKVVKVSVDGRDGDLNLSRTLTGEMKFENREASFSFLVTEGTQSEREESINNILNLIHGKELNIIEPDDTEYYLVGECRVSDIKNDKAYGSFKITADCEPYRYSVNEINRVVALSSTQSSIVLTNNGRKTVTPTITVSDTANIAFNGSTTSLSAGTYKLSALQLATGTTTVTVSGSGDVTFTYREAVL
jgi:phage-related protein